MKIQKQNHFRGEGKKKKCRICITPSRRITDILSALCLFGMMSTIFANRRCWVDKDSKVKSPVSSLRPPAPLVASSNLTEIAGSQHTWVDKDSKVKSVSSGPPAPLVASSNPTEIAGSQHTHDSPALSVKLGKAIFKINRPSVTKHFKITNSSIAADTAKSLDFVIAAFPKTATSTVMRWLGDAERLFVPGEEQCQFPGGHRGGEKTWGSKGASALIEGLITHQIEHPDMKRGIKCPDMLEDLLFTDVYSKFFPNTDIIIGIRHPVLWFQSYYNYRVAELVNRGKNLDFPNANKLITSKEMDGVSGDRANFVPSLSKLGKTQLGPEELQLLANMTVLKERNDEKKVAVMKYLEMIGSSRPSLGKVFLYDIAQLSDKNEERATKFRSDFAAFLKLEDTTLPPPSTTVNANRAGSSAYKEQKLDICEDVYIDLRTKLLQHGKDMSEWLLEYFLESEDVHVSDKEYLTSILKEYSVDPCLENSSMQS